MLSDFLDSLYSTNCRNNGAYHFTLNLNLSSYQVTFWNFLQLHGGKKKKKKKTTFFFSLIHIPSWSRSSDSMQWKSGNFIASFLKVAAITEQQDPALRWKTDITASFSQFSSGCASHGATAEAAGEIRAKHIHHIYICSQIGFGAHVSSSQPQHLSLSPSFPFLIPDCLFLLPHPHTP